MGDRMWEHFGGEFPPLGKPGVGGNSKGRCGGPEENPGGPFFPNQRKVLGFPAPFPNSGKGIKGRRKAGARWEPKGLKPGSGCR